MYGSFRPEYFVVQCYRMNLFAWLNEESDESSAEVPPLVRSNPVLNARLDELAHQTVREAMIPRSLVKALDVDIQLRRVRRLKSSKNLYFPVYKGDLDQILGWISKQKVMELMNEMGDDAQISQHVRPVGFVPEGLPLSGLADAFLKSHSPVLIVQGPQDTTLGVVTVADFAELLFGFELAPSETASVADGVGITPRNYDL